MITEHNYPTLYYPVVSTPDGPRYLGDDWWRLTDNKDQAKLFPHPGDAKRWAERGGHSGKYRLAIVGLPFVVEYQEGPIWQQMRYYRTLDTALAGWEIYTSDAVGRRLNYLWRLRHSRTDQIFKEERPARASQGVKPVGKKEGTNDG